MKTAVLFAVSARFPQRIGSLSLLGAGAFGAVLRWGVMSFDPPLALLPMLGAPYGDELAAGRIALHFAADSGRFYIGYGPHVFPVCPIDYPAILQSADRADLSALAERFHGLTTQPADQPRAAEGRDMLREFVAQNGGSAIELVLEAWT